MRLDEIANQPYKFSRSELFGGVYYDFDSVDGSVFRIAFNRNPEASPECYGVGVQSIPEDSLFVVIEFSRNNGYDITGSGDAYRIFATVKAAFINYVSEFVDDKDETFFVFVASEPSRRKLYDRMARTPPLKLEAAFESQDGNNARVYFCKVI